MSTTSEHVAVENQHQYVDFDEYVGYHLSRTQSGIKYSEIFTRLAWIAALGLFYLLLFTVTDHWVLEGGVGRPTRIVLLLTLVVLGAGWFVWRVAVPYFRSINALYAAREIEQAAPALKGGLFNLVDLQNHKKQIPNHVRVAIEKYAALELSNIDVDKTVDRRPLMRVSSLLFITVTIWCLYAMFSPKDVLASVKRALLPLSNTSSPTQTRITDVDPGDSSEPERATVEVTVTIGGHQPGAVTLYYSTGDRKYVDEPLPMQRQTEEGGGLLIYKATLAGENGRGLLEDVKYHIEAGDATNGPYTITVSKSPSAQVIETSYEFPSYMRLPTRTEASGHINAYEGAIVTVQAKTNDTPVKTAWIELMQDDRPTGEQITMTVSEGDEGKQLTASWKLELPVDEIGGHGDQDVSQHYRIQCKTQDGKRDRNPIVYNLNIKKDPDPEVALLFPTQNLQRPANGVIALQYQASDPVFGLRSLELIVEKDGSKILKQSLVGEEQLTQRVTPLVDGLFDWKLESLHLSPGDRLSFYLLATDNKQPSGNTKTTTPLFLEIIEPVSEEEAERQLQEDKQRLREEMQQQPAEENARDRGEDQPKPEKDEQQQPEQGERQQEESGEEGEQGDAGSKQTQPGEEGESATNDGGEGDDGGQTGNEPGTDGQGAGEQQPRPLDPENLEDQEKALEEILKHQREKAEQQDEQNPQQPDDQEQQKTGEEQSPDGSSAPGDKTKKEQSDNQDGSQNQEQQPPGSRPDEKKPSGDTPSTPGEPGGESPSGDPAQSDEQTPENGAPNEGGNQPKQPSDDGQAGKPAPPKPDSDSTGKQEDGVQGEEKTAADDPNAVKKEATGEETGPAKSADQQDAKQAKNKLDRQGEKNDKGRKPGDPGAKPDAAEKGNQDDPDKSKAKPKPGDSQDQQPDGPKGEQKNKPRDDSQTRPEDKPENSNDPPQGKGRKDQKSPEPQEGEQGNSSESEEGEKGSTEPGAGDDAPQPGDKSEGDPGSKPDDKKGEKSSDKSKGGEASKEGGDQDSESAKDGSPSKGGSKSDTESSQSQSDTPPPDAPPSGPPSETGGTTGGGAAPDPDDGTKAPGSQAEAEQPADTQKQEDKDGQGDEDDAALPGPEAANLEYKKKAIPLVLKKLQDQLERGEVDEELKKRLGWNDEQLRKFTEKLQEQLQRAGTETDDNPASIAERRQFEEMLRDLKIAPQTKKRTSSSKNQQRVRQLEKKRTPPPSRYRRIYREFTRSLSKTSKPQPRNSKKSPVKKRP